MARTFNGDIANRLSGSSPVSGVPLTMACWFRANSANSVGQGLMYIGDAANDFFRLTYQSNTAGDPLRAQIGDASTFITADSSGVTDDDWHHAAAVFSSNGSAKVSQDGTTSTTTATALNPTSITASRIGVWERASSGGLLQPLDGALAWPCIWNVALTDNELSALSTGVNPLQIRPKSIQAYWPLYGVSSAGESDVIGTYALSETGTVGVGESPLVFLGGAIRVYSIPAAAGGFQAAWARGSNVILGTAA